MNVSKTIMYAHFAISARRHNNEIRFLGATMRKKKTAKESEKWKVTT